MTFFLAEVPTEPSQLRIYVAIVGILIIIFTLFRMNRRRRQRIAASGEASPIPVQAESPTATKAAISQDLQHVMAQLQEVTREVEGRLDTRVRFAQRLLQESEAAADRLESLVAQVRDIEASKRLDVETVAQKSPPKKTPDPAPEDPSVGQKLDVVSAPATPERDQILELSKAGKSAPEIAAETGLPIGEVELIVNLGRAKKKTP